MGWQQGARSKKKCSKCSIGQQHQAGRRSILYQDLNYRLVSSKLPNYFFGALVMRVLQPTNLNTIEPAILKLHLGKPSGELWWITMMTLVMVSLFDQFVPFSSFEWKAKIWIGSHLILQYNFSRKRIDLSTANEILGISRNLIGWWKFKFNAEKSNLPR